MAVTIMPKDVTDATIAGLTIAMFITFVRLGIRAKTKKLGWDDFWAGVSIIGACPLLAGVVIIFNPKPSMTQLTHVAAYYMASEAFYMVVWTSRLSILCTIIRISPTQSLRRILYLIGSAFGAMWMLLLIQELIICEREPSWKNQLPAQCNLGKTVAISQLVTDIIADLCLIISPINLIWRSHLSSGHRLRIIAIFSSCILVTVGSLVHAYWILANFGLNEIFTAIFEATVSMIVASIGVIFGYVYQFSGRQSSSFHSSGYAPQGFELNRRTKPSAISVDITTTRLAETDTAVHLRKDDAGPDYYGEVTDDLTYQKRYNHDVA